MRCLTAIRRHSKERKVREKGFAPLSLPRNPYCSRIPLAKLLNDLVDLVGIEPTTSSMP
jgi:hypothetical protein